MPPRLSTGPEQFSQHKRLISHNITSSKVSSNLFILMPSQKEYKNEGDGGAEVEETLGRVELKWGRSGRSVGVAKNGGRRWGCKYS